VESMEVKLSKRRVEQTDLEYILDKAKDEFILLSNKQLLISGAGGFLGYYFIKSVLAWNDRNPKKLFI